MCTREWWWGWRPANSILFLLLSHCRLLYRSGSIVIVSLLFVILSLSIFFCYSFYISFSSIRMTIVAQVAIHTWQIRAVINCKPNKTIYSCISFFFYLLNMSNMNTSRHHWSWRSCFAVVKHNKKTKKQHNHQSKWVNYDNRY